MSEEPKKTSGIKEKKGYYEVTYLKDMPGVKKGTKEVRHWSTAEVLERKSIVSVGERLKKYVPSHAEK